MGTKISIKKIVFAAIAGLFVFSSCSKERTEEEAPKSIQNTYTTTDDFYNQNQPPEQEFIIDSLGSDSLTGLQGTKIWGLPKIIFKYKLYPQDSLYYPYKIKLVEAYSIKDMILVRLPSLAQSKVLHSGGELKVLASKDNKELILKQGYGYHMLARSSSPVSGMGVFYGFTNGTTNDWNANVLQTDYTYPNDTVTSIFNQSNGYNMQIAKMGWVTPSKFFQFTNQANITFTAEGTNTNLIDVYIIFKNLHAYVKVSNMAANGLPAGEPITVLAIGKDSSTMYYYKQDFTSSTSQVQITMQATTSSQLLSLMDNL